MTLSTARVVDLVEYGHGQTGFAIETLGYWNLDHEHYAIPAWDERGLGSLSGPFKTAAEAQAALDDAREWA